MKNNFCMVTFHDVDFWRGFDFAICLTHIQDRFSVYAQKNDLNALKETLVNAMVCETLNHDLEEWGKADDENRCKKYIVECLNVSFHQKRDMAQSHHDLVAVYDVNLKQLDKDRNHTFINHINDFS